MMREFQAETDRDQAKIDPIHIPTTTSNEPMITLPIKEQILPEQDINPMKVNSNRSESRTITEKNKLNIKSVSRLTCDTIASRRSTHDSQNSLSTIHVRVKPNDKVGERMFILIDEEIHC